MTFQQYLNHYFTVPDVLIFLLVSTLVLLLMHILIRVFGSLGIRNTDKRRLRLRFWTLCEEYYELMFASSSILFFVGLYFLISYHYFSWPASFYGFWDKYKDFLLLASLIVAILMTDILDGILIRLTRITNEKKGTLRMAAMIYMLVIFAYIKFIYEDNNYDSIIIYFIVMIIGRFVYFDASFRDFIAAMKNLFMSFPILLLVLSTTGIMALYGFTSGYLLRGNGVVVSLWIAHVFMILEIMIVCFVNKIVSLSRRDYKE